MEFIENYVQSRLDYESAELDLINNLEKTLGISPMNIKHIRLTNKIENSAIIQVLEIELIGTNSLRSEDIAKMKELTIVTPNTIQINVGEIHL